MNSRKKYLLKISKDIVMTYGKGIYLYDNKGNKYYDMTASAWSMNLGYGNKKIEKAIVNQVKQLVHCRTHFDTEVKLELAKRISDLSPIPNGRVDFCLHGSTANEGAMKLALNYKQGSGAILYLENGFHGKTFGTMAITWKHQNKKFDSFYGKGIECKKDLKDIEKKIKKHNPSAIILELVQGNGGMNPLKYDFVQGIAQLCKQYDVTMIVDEIQTAFGRCGSFFVSDDYGLEPDIITYGKGIGGGMPIFGIICNSKYDYETDDHSFTFSHFPPSMASALAYLDQLTPELLESVDDKGEYVRAKLENLSRDHCCLGCIKGWGFMLGIEIINKDGSPNIKLAEKIIDKMFENKIIMNLDKCAGFGYTLKFKPALTITYNEIDYVIKILDKILTEIENENNRSRIKRI